MSQNRNIDEVVAWLTDFVESFDFQRPGVDQSLGRYLVRSGGDDEPNFRTGQMLSVTSVGLNAKTVINKHEIEIRYGISQPPSASAVPNGYIDNRDKLVTYTQKAEWARMENGTKPKPEFYGFGQGDAEALLKVAQVSLNDYIRQNPYGSA